MQQRKIGGVVIQPRLHDPETIDKIRRRAIYRKDVPAAQYRTDVRILMEMIAAREAQLTGALASPIAPDAPTVPDAPSASPAPVPPRTAAASESTAPDTVAPDATPRPRVGDPGDRLADILAQLDTIHRTPDGGRTA